MEGEDFDPFTIISSGTNDPSFMDPIIWSKLPQSLIDRILVFLPLPSFFRSRCVCRRWYMLLFSSNFLELHHKLSPVRNWFIFFSQNSIGSSNLKSSVSHGINIRECFMFDPGENFWCKISFSDIVPPGFSPAEVSGGLICFISMAAATKTLILVNPLTKAMTQIPATTTPRLYPSVGFTLKTSSISFIIAGDDLISPFAVKNLTAEKIQYDGFGSFYNTVSNMPRLCNLESGRMVFVDGKYYCMNYNPYSILVYHAQENVWFKIQAPMRRYLKWPSLVKIEEKVMLVAAVEKRKLNVPRSIRIWGLQSGGSTWLELERMPKVFYEQLNGTGSGVEFYCVGHGALISVTIKSSMDVLLFDFIRKVWWWAPKCPFTGAGGGFLGFAYDPRLVTPEIGLLDSTVIGF